jgi:hypothetical protein
VALNDPRDVRADLLPAPRLVVPPRLVAPGSPESATLMPQVKRDQQDQGD